jgi:hypothetical protein
MSAAVFRVVATLLVAVVEVPIDKEFYAFLYGELIGADRLVCLGLLATVKAIYIDERAIVSAVAPTKI